LRRYPPIGAQPIPRILIVIPVYNESTRLPFLLDEIARGRDGGGLALDFLLIDDGSAPEDHARTLALIEARGLEGSLKCLRLPANGGKGSALKRGFECALSDGYDYAGFLDADGSTSVAELRRAMEYFAARSETPLAAVIGSRVALLGRDVSRSAVRHYLGRVFATFVSLLFGARVYDTQCGMKLFRVSALRRYIGEPTDPRWVWDTELVLAMLAAGETVHEFPVDWRETGGSKLSFARDPLMMALRLMQFRFRKRDGS
jgi:dolichyl-phosphate beta-glucosyltransferase